MSITLSATTSKARSRGDRLILGGVCSYPTTIAALRSVPIELLQLQAIAQEANVAGVGMKHVYGPVLSLSSIVAKRTCDFEFERPLIRNQQIGRPLSLDRLAVERQRSKVFGDCSEELRLAVWSDTGSELFERNTATVKNRKGVSLVRWYF
jgi:hypothetical protein